MSIGLYIPCFNAARHIREVLDAVFTQRLRPDEVVVLDDASTDRIHEIIVRYPVRIIRHPTNKGLAAARNTAIKNLHTEFIASLDADCVPESDWLERLMRGFRSSKRAGLGGRLIETYTRTLSDQWRSVHMRQDWGEKKRNPRFLFGSNTVFRRSAIIKAGWYNEAYRNNYEDVDMCNRLKKLGDTMAYEPRAIAYHRKKDDIASLLNSHWQWNFAYYQKRNFYASPKRFALKLKYNIYGLANRYIEHDLAAGRSQLAYLDFLLALHHSIRDLEYFIRPRAPQKDNAMQNFLMFNAVSVRVVQHYFRNGNFKRALYRHLLCSLGRTKTVSLFEKALYGSDVHLGWSVLLKKKYTAAYPFLKSFAFHLYWWLDKLERNPDNIIKKIALAAKETE